MGPLLSFCIPTFNRSAYLAERLEEVCAYLPSSEEANIQILVSDNGSSDGTSLVIKAFQSRLPLEYFRLPLNRGVDMNLLSCISRAAGKYIWLFGDDDSLQANSFERVLEEIRKDRYSTIILNQRNGSNLRAHCPVFNEALFPTETDEEMTLQELCHKYSYLSVLGNISGIIFKRPELHPFDWSRHAAYKTGFAHTSIIFETLYNKLAIRVADTLFSSDPPPEHLSFEHRESRERELDFRNWSLNLSVFLSDMLEQKIVTDTHRSNFFNVSHIEDSMMTHILMAFQGQMLRLAEIPSTHWEKAERFSRALDSRGDYERVRALKILYDVLTSGLRGSILPDDIRSNIHWHSERIIRSQRVTAERQAAASL